MQGCIFIHTIQTCACWAQLATPPDHSLPALSDSTSQRCSARLPLHTAPAFHVSARPQRPSSDSRPTNPKAAAMSKQRHLRKKRALSEEGEEEGSAPADALTASTAGEPTPELLRDNLEDIKLLQRQRKRLAGVRAEALAMRTATGAGAQDDADQDNDLMEAYVKEQATGRVLDEEAHMQKFIETELAKRLGKKIEDGEGQLSRQEMEEQELYSVPEGLQAQLKQEVVIPGLITAITEVEVSREDKLRKIEETEAFKRRMLATSHLAEGGGTGSGEEEGAGAGQLRRRDFIFSFGRQKERQQQQPGAKQQPRRTISEQRSAKDRR